MQLNKDETYLEKFNVTIVTSERILDFVLPYKLKEIIEGGNITNLPDVTVIEDTNKEIQIVFQNQLLIVSFVKPEDHGLSEASKKLVHYVLRAFETIESLDVVAFGFNYDGKGKILPEIPATEYFRNIFIKEYQELFASGFGEIIELRPDFTVKTDEGRININLKPSKGQTDFMFHCNFHFDNEFKKEAHELEKEIIERYEYFKDLLENIERG